MIRAEGIGKTFDGFEALKQLNLHVEKGSVYGLVGPNGAGKTTFIKCLTGVYKPSSGNIKIDDKSADDLSVRQRIVYIGDDLHFFHGYSIRDLAKYYAGIYKTWSWEEYERLKSVFKLDEKRKLRRLSKGMQKQAAFWIGIACQGDIMVLDEPVDGLDPVMRRAMWSVVLDKVAEQGMTVLVSSHNLRELEDVCDHVGIMFEGSVVIEKSLDDVRGNIHKVQLAFEGEMPKEFSERLHILKESSIGSVHMLIVRDLEEKVREVASPFHPLFLDILPLTLEEIFIYELGGMGYAFENVLA